MQNLEKYLDELVLKYETVDFIKNDPVQFPHRFKKRIDIEVSALISSSLAYGKREAFIQKLEFIHQLMGNSPAEFCLKFDYEKDYNCLDGFCYRFTVGTDVSLLFNSISMALKEYGSLEKLFMKNYSKEDKNIKQALTAFVGGLYDYNKDCNINKKGFYHLLPNPKQGSACKRLNLFLKWMVRKEPVDFNLWQNIDKSKLIIPLDVHVARISRKLDLTQRKANDWVTAEEITEKLKSYDSKDPVKYDFALFDIGIDNLL